MALSNAPPEKILLIRFSSFGDVLQTLSVVGALRKRWPEAEVHWVTRSEFLPLIQGHPGLARAWGLERQQGLVGLLKMARQLHGESFTRVYDAHNNLRSTVIVFSLWIRALFTNQPQPSFIRRSLRRWQRFLLFKLRINRFEQPFSGQRDLLEPLQIWNISKTPVSAPQLFLPLPAQQAAVERLQNIPSFVALAPSAAFALKRWPMEHWTSLLQIWLTQDPQIHFVLLGGPEDHFVSELAKLDSRRIHNFVAKLTLAESATVVQQSKLLIANDTGLLHVGEQLGHPTIALMGPAPFGFPCRRESTSILELDLSCRPCSKHGQGPCRNTHFQLCLVGIRPEMVFEQALLRLAKPDNERR
jgi:ADP-heptose:LPS heptosyltransferase